ncbi:methylenetetrahydrofolate reductase [Peptococcaceae bacterium SCADC1_2_3]|nr:methylenetetrahydrofolate reductase [Peptococcaceae bacterium SCADC1_2_3]
MSRLAKLLQQEEFVVTAEINPPKHACPESIKCQAEYISRYVDALNITDCSTAVVRLSSIAAGFHVLSCGVELIIQMTCRDRNRIAMQSDLLGAYSLGMRNILCLSGDHQKFGNHPTAKNVYDLDSIQFIYYLNRLQTEKIFFSGESIKENVPHFFIGAVINPFADPREFQVIRLEKKIRAGAKFIQTQCIFDLEGFADFMEQVEWRGLHQKTHILAGVAPLKNYRVAQYMQNNVPGIVVPDKVTNRMQRAVHPAREGIAICVEQIKRIREMKGIKGIHIMAMGWGNFEKRYLGQ